MEKGTSDTHFQRDGIYASAIYKNGQLKVKL